MESLIALGVLVALALLAPRFGHDSRDGFRSHEHDFAARGLTWDGVPAPPSAAERGMAPNAARPKGDVILATETWQVEDSAAETYEAQLVPAFFAPWAPHLLDAAGVERGDWVLDVACGTGIVAREAATRVGPRGRVTGLDLNPGMLAVARRFRSDIIWQEGDAEALPFADGAFDRVLCQFSLMYFPDRVAALREMRRVLAPSGTVGITIWAAPDQRSPFVQLSEILERHAGREPADIVLSPFVLGDLDGVRSLLTAADLRVVRAETQAAPTTFRSVDAFVHAEVAGTPLAGMLRERGDAVYRQVIEETRAALLPYCDDRGFSFPMDAHLLIARGSG